MWRLPKFKPQYFSYRDLDRIWRPRSSRARSAWTSGVKIIPSQSVWTSGPVTNVVKSDLGCGRWSLAWGGYKGLNARRENHPGPSSSRARSAWMSASSRSLVGIHHRLSEINVCKIHLSVCPSVCRGPETQIPIDSRIAKVWKSVPSNLRAQKLFKTSISLLLLYLPSPESWVPTNPGPKSLCPGFKLLTGVPAVKEPNGKKKHGAGRAAPRCVKPRE